MQTWLLVTAVLPVATQPNAALKTMGLAPVETAHVATAHTLDLRLSQEIGNTRAVPLLRGPIIQRSVAPNAFIGVGLSNLYGKRRTAFDASDDGRPKRSKKPAVTFVLKF